MFKLKYNSDVSIERYKARLAQKSSQVNRINHTEIFAPTIKRESLKIFLAIAIMLEIILIQMDLMHAYLESALEQNNS